MTDMRKTVKCSNCGNEATVNINSDLDMSELLLAGKCTSCGNSMQITYNIVEKAPEPAAPSTSPEEPVVNLDESLSTPDPPSDTLRDIMEE